MTSVRDIMSEEIVQEYFYYPIFTAKALEQDLERYFTDGCKLSGPKQIVRDYAGGRFRLT